MAVVPLLTPPPSPAPSLLSRYAETPASGGHSERPPGQRGHGRAVLVPLHAGGVRVAGDRASHGLPDLPVSVRRVRQLHTFAAAGHALYVSRGRGLEANA